MQLTEQHVIARTDPRYAVIDAAAFASKNLYNAANYLYRQAFIHQGMYLNYHKDKQQGRNILVYTIQAISKRALRKGVIVPSQLAIQIQTKQQSVDQVRIVPRKGFYVVEVVYECEVQPSATRSDWYAGVDIGVNNLAALASNKPGFVPVVVNGRPVKSCNQFYNKRKAELQQKLGSTGTTWRMERLTNKRTRRIDHLLHTASRRIIDLLVREGIGTLIIGKNILWKQECQLRKADKQHFVQLPHARFIDMLTYKAQLVGIKVVVTEESYTSAASFLDLDPIPVYGGVEEEPQFCGRRLTRGLYRAADGREINADVQGAYNMIRKVVPNAYVAEGIEDGKAVLARLVVHPSRTVRLNPQRRESLPTLANDPGQAKEACNQ